MAATSLAILLSAQIDGESAATASRLHQMQSERIDSLERKVARLNQRLIDGAIIVIDCQEQNTGRKTK